MGPARMPLVLRRVRLASLLTGLVLALACVPARAASPYGVLDHFDVCSGTGSTDYVPLRSIAVDPAGYIYVSGDDGIIRALSPGGQPLGTITSGPSRAWESPVVANGLAGVVYVGDSGGPSDPAQLAKYTLSGGNLVLAHTYATNQGGYATTTGIIEVAGLGATRDEAGNTYLYILDPSQGIVELNEANGSFVSLTRPGGKGRPVAMTPITNAIVTAATNDDGTPDWTAYYAGNPLSYRGELNVSPGIVGVADNYDGTIWVLTSAGLEHYKYATLLDTVPVSGYAIDTRPGGSVWIVRSDGILHIGPGGGTIPPDQYGHAPCGGPQISDSLPRQSIRASHQLEVAARCADPCSLISAATLTVPGSRTTYNLVAPAASYSASGSFDLRLGLRRPAYNALVGALKHHRRGTVLLKLGSIDAGAVRAYYQQRIVIS